MSVIVSDVVIYGSANMPEADGVTIGGAIDLTKRIDFTDLSSAGTLDIVSSSASDTATQCKYGVRDSTGAIQVNTITANGTTVVLGGQSSERLLYALLSGATANGPTTAPAGSAAVGDICLGVHACVLPGGSAMNDGTIQTGQAGSANKTTSLPALFQLAAGQAASVSVGQIIWTRGGTGANQLRRIVATSGFGTDIVAVNRDWGVVPNATTTYKVLNGMLFEILPNPVTAIIRMFGTSAADIPTGAQRIYYEKVFAVNNNTSISETGAQVEIAFETPTLSAGALLDMALTTGLNDTGTVANRQTAPVSGIGAFVTQPAFISVPSPGNLPAGNAPNAAGAQGMWLRLTLPAGTAAYKGLVDFRVQGVTT